jgi:hypothetical protein
MSVFFVGTFFVIFLTKKDLNLHQYRQKYGREFFTKS